MIDIENYISKKLLREFTRKVPELRKKTASVPFAERKMTYGLSGNTFRAFTGWKHKPSKIYREWAESTTE